MSVIFLEKDVATPSSRRLLRMAWPLGAAGLAESSMLIVDTWLLGRLGAAPLGAVAYGGVICFLLYTTCLAIMRGVKVSAAHEVGQKNQAGAEGAFAAGLLLAFGLSLLFLAILHVTTDAARVFGVAPDLLPDLHRFLKARAAGVPAACFLMAVMEYRQAHGDTRPAPIVVLGGAIIHAALALYFIGGHAGDSLAGVVGAGVAIAITEWAQCIAIIFYAYRQDTGARQRAPFLRRLRAGLGALPRVLRLGGPSGLQAFGEGSAYLAWVSLIAHMGDVSMATHQLVLSVLRVVVLPALALGEAASVLVAQARGAHALQKIGAVMRAGRAITCVWSVLSAGILICFGQNILRVIGPPEPVFLAACQLLWVAVALALVESQNLLFRGGLRGLGDVRWQAGVGILIAVLCYAGGGIFLGLYLHLGVLGAWLGLLLEKTVDTFFFGRRFSRKYSQTSG